MRKVLAILLFISMYCLQIHLPEPAAAQDTRRDNYFGTFHEGMRIESGPGQDTVITVTPPQRNDTETQSQEYPLIIAPQVNTPRPYPPRPRTQ